MQVISKVTVQIFKERVEAHPVTKELISMPEYAHLIESSPNPQLVPDWVRDNEHYQILAKDGLIMEVVVVENPKPVETPVAIKTGWVKKDAVPAG